MAERLLFEAGILKVSPPWLRRTQGGALMQSFGKAIDGIVDRSIEAVAVRFPSTTYPGALPLISRDRRIRRGPQESDANFAARVLTWWTDHRTRGGPRALLRQLRAFWGGTIGTIELVYQSGRTHAIDVAGTITERDFAGWRQKVRCTRQQDSL